MKALIVGMGFGNLYKDVHISLGHDVVTVDLHRAADYKSIKDAVRDHQGFDIAHICTPNFTHLELARELAPVTGIVVVEKPGVDHSGSWEELVLGYPNTRFMMSKNNMWRDNIKEMQKHIPSARTVKIKWINKDRIPGPGTWFTDRSLAYGGVSRDLMPHLLSLFIALNKDWESSNIVGKETRQLHTLDTIKSTEYGEVNLNGVYNVDDLAKIKFMKHGRVWKLEANWADHNEDNRAIEFEMDNGLVQRYELGLCPEEAYKAMVQDAINNVNNDEFWHSQYCQDSWIHQQVEGL